jgi:hypothetical protein
MFLTGQALHAQGKISRSEIWVTEPVFSGVPLQVSWLETCQARFKIVIAVMALTTVLVIEDVIY